MQTVLFTYCLEEEVVKVLAPLEKMFAKWIVEQGSGEGS